MLLAAALAAAAAAAVAGPAPASSAQTPARLTIYSSFPLQGASRPQSRDIVRAIRLAIADRGGTAGGHPLRHVSLDDSTAAAGQWTARRTRRNARRAARDDSAIAYLGEFNSGASANSIPTINEAGLLQVSPSNTARGLTRSGPGARPGEPDRYYPTGVRTYGRVIPLDDVQARAQVASMRRQGVRRLFVLHDREPYGRGVSAFVRRAARRGGIALAGRASWDGRRRSYRGLARKVRRARADAVFAGGIVDNNAARLFRDLHRTRSRMPLFGPDGMATADLTGELPPGVQRRVTLTAPPVAPAELPAAGQDVRRRLGGADRVDPYALYAYAAADAVLDAIERGGDDREAVIDAFFDHPQPDSVLGPFAIDKHGDTTLELFGEYGARGGRLVYRGAYRG